MAMINSKKDLLTVKEVAELLQVSQGHIRNLCSKRRIPYLKINGVGVRFLRKEIKQWILDCKNSK